jgi:ribosomal protein L11 methyltransferase
MQQAMAAMLTPLAKIEDEYDLVVANIVHDVLLELGEDLARSTRVGGMLILSGLLAGKQVESIEGYFRKQHFSPLERRERGEWAALSLRRQG